MFNILPVSTQLNVGFDIRSKAQLRNLHHTPASHPNLLPHKPFLVTLSEKVSCDVEAIVSVATTIVVTIKVSSKTDHPTPTPNPPPSKWFHMSSNIKGNHPSYLTFKRFYIWLFIWYIYQCVLCTHMGGYFNIIPISWFKPPSLVWSNRSLSPDLGFRVGGYLPLRYVDWYCVLLIGIFLSSFICGIVSTTIIIVCISSLLCIQR